MQADEENGITAPQEEQFNIMFEQRNEQPQNIQSEMSERRSMEPQQREGQHYLPQVVIPRKKTQMRPSALERKTQLENELLPEKLEMVKQVSEGYLTKQKLILQSLIDEEVEALKATSPKSRNHLSGLDGQSQRYQTAYEERKGEQQPFLDNSFNDDNQDYYNQISEDTAVGLIKMELRQMGFGFKQIQELFNNEKQIEDSNHAVELLIKGPNGWIHKYAPNIDSGLCKICNEDRNEHFHSNTTPFVPSFQPQNNNDNSLRTLRLSGGLASNQSDSQQPQGAMQLKVQPVESGVSCGICYMDYLAKDMHGLTTCSHKFCLNCITDYLEYNITNGQVRTIKCAEMACKEEYTRDDIRKFGSQEIYQKYLKFKENIDVNMNPDLRWCPRPNCTHFVKKGLRRKVTCECGQEICFKCGAQWHENKRCDAAMDGEFYQWAADNKNVQNCPKCRSRIEKDGGCNHMTCQQCKHQWCWLCRGRYYKGHYDWWNPIGCMGGQFESYSTGCVILMTFGQLLMLPFLLLFGPIVLCTVGCASKCFCDYEYFANCNWFFCSVSFILLVPLAIACGCVLGALALGLLIVPGYILIIIKLIRLLCCTCSCCLK